MLVAFNAKMVRFPKTFDSAKAGTGFPGVAAKL